MSSIPKILNALANGARRRFLRPPGNRNRKSVHKPKPKKDATKFSRLGWVGRFRSLQKQVLNSRRARALKRRKWFRQKFRNFDKRLTAVRATLSGWRYWLAILAAVVLVLGAGIGVYKGWQSAQIRKATLATVNSEPITQVDLAAELVATGIDYKRLDTRARKQLLDRIVERRLLVNIARKQGIANDARTMALRARADETFLADMVLKRFVGTPPPPPSDDDARHYMAAHPAMFAGRQTFVVDAIVCALDGIPTNADVVFKSIDAAESFLRKANVPYRRHTQILDSAGLAADAAAGLAKSRPDDVFVLPQGRMTLIGTVQRRSAANTPAEIQLEMAREILSKQQITERLGRAVGELRARADVRYFQQ